MTMKSPARPVEFSRDGAVHVHTGTVRRLNDLALIGFRLREQMEAAEEELCYLLGVDPSEDTVEADWCRQCVRHGVPVEIAVEQVRIAKLGE